MRFVIKRIVHGARKNARHSCPASSGKSLGRFSLAFSLGRFRCLARHTPKADPEKVCSGFPSRQTQRVCAEIMLNQKSRAQWRFNPSRSSCGAS
jgi:hypothetical protein